MKYFITGIGTNVGKTIVSAIFAQSLKADYWKPVQSGTSEGLDSVTVRSLISNTETNIFPESYLLTQPLSPHLAARYDKVTVELNKIVLPHSLNDLIIEGAGGLLVPLNDEHYVIDLAEKFDCEIVLVIQIIWVALITAYFLLIIYFPGN